MRKRIAILVTLALALLCAAALAEVEINEINFPDPVFRKCVSDAFDNSRADGVLSDDEIAAATFLDVSKKGISSLKGVEKLTALKVLYCDENSLTELDLSQNKMLEHVMCDCNGLKTLNVKGLGNLKSLQCYKNQLTELDVTTCRSLDYFSCDSNQLTKLDVTTLTSVRNLYIGRNPLTEVDLTQCGEVESLGVCGTNLTSLNVSFCTALRSLQADGCKLTSLDVTKNTELIWLWCANNEIKELDVSKCQVINNLVKTKKPQIQDSTIQWGTNQSNEPGLWVDDTTKIITDEGEYEPDAERPVTALRLNKKKATLTRTGKDPKPTLQLIAAVSPENATNDTLKWTSSNKRVAKVDQSGRVTAIRAGTAIITCAATDGSGKKATCKITVKDATVRKIELNKTKATLRKGKTLQLKVKKFTPADPLKTEVKWSTSNKRVATVNSKGLVKAVGAGSCNIVCTAADGSGVKAVCRITVKAK